MFVIEDVEQSVVVGHVVVLSMQVTEPELIPPTTYLDDDGNHPPNKVLLIKLLRNHANTSLRDGKRIIEMVLGGIEIHVKMAVNLKLLPDFMSAFKRYGIEIRCVNTDPVDRPEYQGALISMLPQLPQRQDALNDQLEDLVLVANKLGMYDAADLIRNNILRRS